jgi:hypothetical protein
MEMRDLINLNAPAIGPSHIETTARMIGCEPAVLRAVLQVECKGRGFDRKGRPVMLFEPHIFHRLLTGEKRRRAIESGLAYAKWGTRPYPRDSYPRLMAARRIDEECALQAASWGLPQILGVNHRPAGYHSAADMVMAFCEGEDVHLDAMARFIVANRLGDALKRRDWGAFAYGYNGPRYAVNAYDKALAQAYAHFKVDHPMAVLIVPLPGPRPISGPSGPIAAQRDDGWLSRRVAAIFGR